MLLCLTAFGVFVTSQHESRLRTKGHSTGNGQKNKIDAEYQHFNANWTIKYALIETVQGRSV